MIVTGVGTCLVYVLWFGGTNTDSKGEFLDYTNRIDSLKSELLIQDYNLNQAEIKADSLLEIWANRDIDEDILEPIKIIYDEKRNNIDKLPADALVREFAEWLPQ